MFTIIAAITVAAAIEQSGKNSLKARSRRVSGPLGWIPLYASWRFKCWAGSPIAKMQKWKRSDDSASKLFLMPKLAEAG